MQAELTGILHGEVELITVTAGEVAADETTVADQSQHTQGIVIVYDILAGVEVVARTASVKESVDILDGLYGVVLGVADGLGVGNLGGETFQWLDPTEVWFCTATKLYSWVALVGMPFSIPL